MLIPNVWHFKTFVMKPTLLHQGGSGTSGKDIIRTTLFVLKSLECTKHLMLMPSSRSVSFFFGWITQTDFIMYLQNYSREAIIWSAFNHPNLLPFYGIYRVSERLGCVGLVSPWMENGNINEYLQANPGAPRLPLVRMT